MARFEHLLERIIVRHHGIRLSRREIEIIGAAARGLRTKETAAELGCSPKTIDERWRRLYLKFNCDSRMEILASVLGVLLDQLQLSD